MAVSSVTNRLITDPNLIRAFTDRLPMNEAGVRKVLTDLTSKSAPDLQRNIDKVEPALNAGKTTEAAQTGTTTNGVGAEGAINTRPHEASTDAGPDGGYSQLATGSQSTEGSTKAAEAATAQRVGDKLAQEASARAPIAGGRDDSGRSNAAPAIANASAGTQALHNAQAEDAFASRAATPLQASPSFIAETMASRGLIAPDQVDAFTAHLTQSAISMGGIPGGSNAIPTTAHLAANLLLNGPSAVDGGSATANMGTNSIINGGMNGAVTGMGVGAGAGALAGSFFGPLGTLAGGAIGGYLGAKTGANMGAMAAVPGAVANPGFTAMPGMGSNSVLMGITSFMSRTGGMGGGGGLLGMGSLGSGFGTSINNMTSLMRQGAIDANDREALRIVNSNMPIEAKIALYMARINERSGLELEKKMAEAEAARQREKDEEQWGKMVESIGSVPVVGQAISSALTLAKGASEMGRTRAKSSTALQAELQYQLQVYTQQMAMWSNVLHNMKTVGDTINSNLRG